MTVTSANTWDMIDAYCNTTGKSIIRFNNSKIAAASASKQAEVWTWYANFAEDSVLDMMKTFGTWDMIIELNEDQAIANATAWFPAKEDCPNKDEDYYWECHVIGADGDFCWKNADAVPAKSS